MCEVAHHLVLRALLLLLPLQHVLLIEPAPIVRVGVFASEFELVAGSLELFNGTDNIFYSVMSLPTMAPGENDYDYITGLTRHLRRQSYDVLVGPFEGNVAIAAEKLGLPYLVRSFGSSSVGHNSTYFLLPSVEDVCDCVLALIDEYRWTRIGIFYEDHIGLFSKGDLQFESYRGGDDTDRMITGTGEEDFEPITSDIPEYHMIRETNAMMLGKLLENPRIDLRVWRVPTGSSATVLRKPLLSLRDLGITQILVLTPSNTVKTLLEQARRYGMAAEPYSWIFLNLASENFTDQILLDLRTNVTSINFVQPDIRYPGSLKESPLKYSIIKDAVELLMKAAASLNTRKEPIRGPTLADTLFQMKIAGRTGVVDFTPYGGRNNYSLSIYNYHNNSYHKVASWEKRRADSLQNELVFPKGAAAERVNLLTLEGRHLTIVSILESPWTMLREDAHLHTGNEQYEGFIPDMMDQVADMLGFTYALYLVPDGKFGSMKANGEWNGMIGEVLNGNASMTAAPLSINSLRESAIDFTKPFYTRSLNALIKTHHENIHIFQFLQPLSYTVWCCILGATVLVSLALFFIEKVSTSLRNEADDTPNLNGPESGWFVLAAMLGGGSEAVSATVGGRVLTSFWWLFALIIISSYTANLTAFLTVKNINPPISSVYALSGQTKVKYGTVRNSGVENFFKTTKIEPFNKMWEQMVVLGSNVNTTAEGVEKAKQGDYAFIWDSSVTQYIANTDCSLTVIGPAFDHKGFGLALPPGAAFRDDLSIAILKLNDAGILATLDDKWWSGVDCPREGAATGEATAELTVQHVAGIFITLTIGLVLALLTAALDWLAHTCGRHHRNKRGGGTTNGELYTPAQPHKTTDLDSQQ